MGRRRLAEEGARAKAVRQQAMSQGQAGVSQRIGEVVPAGFLIWGAGAFCKLEVLQAAG